MAWLSGSKSDDRNKAAQVAAILREACNRNTPVCVVKPTQSGRVPMARGRLLNLADDRIELEEVRSPGWDVNFRCGDVLDAYFSMNRNLYHFRTTLLTAGEPTRLNRRMVILGMSISRPSAIEQGDRRNLFRVSLSAMEDRATVELWRLRVKGNSKLEADDDPDLENADDSNDGLPPLAFNPEGFDLADIDADSHRAAEYSGWLCDATEAGLGLRLEFVRPERFSIFEPVLVSVRLKKTDEPIRLLCEVRSKRTVNEDGTRLGIVVIPEIDRHASREKTHAIRHFLTEVQRAQLRRESKRSA